jgi:3-methyladenine DNA glycosylase AlkD
MMKRPPSNETKRVAEEAAELLEKGDARYGGQARGAVKKITSFLKKHANKKNVEGMKSFAITCRKTYGVDVPTLRVIAARMGRSLRKGHGGLSLLPELWATGVLENKMIAGMIFYDAAEAHLSANPGNFGTIFKFLEKAIPEFENWAVCDTLCTSGFDRLLSEYPGEIFPALFRWSKEKNLWKKRTPAATIAGYSSAKNFDVRKALALLDNLIGIEEKYVFKAVTWALRNMSKRNAAEVYEYLKGLLNKASAGGLKSKVLFNTVSQGSQKLPPRLQRELKSKIKT